MTFQQLQLFNVKFNEPCYIENKLFETKVNVFQPLNTVGKSPFFTGNVAKLHTTLKSNKVTLLDI